MLFRSWLGGYAFGDVNAKQTVLGMPKATVGVGARLLYVLGAEVYGGTTSGVKISFNIRDSSYFINVDSGLLGDTAISVGSEYKTSNVSSVENLYSVKANTLLLAASAATVITGADVVDMVKDAFPDISPAPVPTID